MKPAFAPASGFDALAPARPLPARRPRARPVARAPGARSRGSTALAAAALLSVVLLEIALQAGIDLHVSPWQDTVGFRQLTGYLMVALLASCMLLGRLRRLPALADRQHVLQVAHQGAGLALVLLLAAHAGGKPSGFLLLLLHALVYATAAGAARTLLSGRIGRDPALALLAVHISLSCLVAAAALLHLYLVYAYTG